MSTEYGDKTTATSNEILRTVVGSGVHGIAIEGTDDHDEMGVFVEPASVVVGLDQAWHQYVYRTQNEGQRSGPGDTDLVIYSLRKYLRLAMVGNPTALLPLYAPEESVLVSSWLGDELRSLRASFLSQQAAERFLGYMHQQHERMLGMGRRSAVPNRPELVAKYGWDTKYGSHALRLAYQCQEIVTDGVLTLPLRDHERAVVLEVKTGQHERATVSRMITHIERRCRQLLAEQHTPLLPEPDWPGISAWSEAAHLGHWRAHR